MIEDVVFVVGGLTAVVAGWRVFRTDSMVRATFFLLGSFVGTALLVLLLRAEFLFVLTVLMMTGEMLVMVIFMVMFMMNPAGLEPMSMVHMPRFSAIAGWVAFVLLAGTALLTDFGAARGVAPDDVTGALGEEFLTGSMVTFEGAAALLLAVMVGAVALAQARGRYGPEEIAIEHDAGGHAHHGHGGDMAGHDMAGHDMAGHEPSGHSGPGHESDEEGS